MGRILVVDDEPLIRRIIAEELMDEGHEVEQAENGQDAMDLLQQRSYELIVSDVQMPDITGLDLLRISRDQPEPTPFLLITAFTDKGLEEAFANGAQAILSKPIDFEQLHAAITRIKQPLSQRYRAIPPGWQTQRSLSATVVISDDARGIQSEHCAIGRGGIFWACEDDFPKLEACIDMELKDRQGQIVLQAGGLVRWVRSMANQGECLGYAVEFEFFRQASPQFLEFLDKIRCTYMPDRLETNNNM